MSIRNTNSTCRLSSSQRALALYKPDSSLGHRVYRKPTHMNLYLNSKLDQHGADLVEYRSNIGQEGDRAWLIIQFTDIRTTIENIMNLPVLVTALSFSVFSKCGSVC
jgi:hypothetical protein